MSKTLLTLLLAPLALSATAGEAPSAERQKALVHMVREDCGSCHGLTLKGGLGPALLPEALAGKDVASLESTILNGRPGTPMPPWKAFLTVDEARWIVQQLQKGFPSDAR